MQVAIINSGCANIASVKYALLRMEANVLVTRDPQEILQADKVIFPGVGSFDYALGTVEEAGLIETMKSLTQPTLGICLGMQMLADGSEEGQKTGLKRIEGQAKHFPPSDTLTVPHMGWNQLTRIADDPLMHGVEQGEHVYFVHSYYLPESPYTIAACDYGIGFTASLRQGNFWGCQFHPELSSTVGEKIFRNFIQL